MTEKEMKEHLKKCTKGDLIERLIMAYLTIRKLQEEKQSNLLKENK